MPAPATGQVLRPGAGRRSFGLRFRAYGKRETIRLGRPEDGWTTEMAERELAVVLRDVSLGTWRAARPDPAPASVVDPTFHEFSSDWFAAKIAEIGENTASNYRNGLTNHLLPFFAEHHLSQITIKEVDRYRQEKVREAADIAAAAEQSKPRMVEILDRRGRRYRRAERPLSARAINMQIFLLAQILDVAVDHEHISRNAARGKRRRLKVSKRRPVHLDSAEHIEVILQAAGELDSAEHLVNVADRRGRSYKRRERKTAGRLAAIALLLLGGGRASATGATLWRDIDLTNRRFEVGRDKTDAGMREVDMLALLHQILTEHKSASTRTAPEDPVLVTLNGKPRDRHNLRKDVVAPVLARAEEIVAQRGSQPLPVGITPHKLRHTFASVLVAIGKDPTYVMAQLGHTDPAFTLRVYSHMMRRSPGERERLKALVEGWGPRAAAANAASAGVLQRTARTEVGADGRSPTSPRR